MEETLDFTPLLLVSVLAVLVPFIAWRLTGGLVPAVVGEVLVGIISANHCSASSHTTTNG